MLSEMSVVFQHAFYRHAAWQERCVSSARKPINPLFARRRPSVKKIKTISWHAALVYGVLLWYWTFMLWSIDKTRYLLTSITWPYLGCKFRWHHGHILFWSWPLTRCWFLIGSLTHVKLTCWNQGQIVWKMIMANTGLKFKFLKYKCLSLLLFCIV